MNSETKLTMVSSILPVAALAMYLAYPEGAAAGSNCNWNNQQYSQGACVDNCWMPFQQSKCVNGGWQSCDWGC